MPNHEVATITPSIVDVGVDLTNNPRVYSKLLDALKISPGEWKQLKDRKELEFLLGLVAQTSRFTIEDNFEDLATTPGVDLAASSTGINLLSALKPNQIKNSVVYSAIGTDVEGHPDNIGRFFSTDIQTTGIYHYSLPVIGSTPTVLVFSHRDDPEKVTAMYPGVAAEIGALPHSTRNNAKIIHIDAYDLQKQPAMDTLDNLIKSAGSGEIALGLGNFSILKGELKQRILQYIEDRKITYLMGNSHEFAELLDTAPVTSLDQANAYKFGNLAPYVLVTLGAQGLIGFEHGIGHYQRAFKPDKAISTSGAGDTAAGVMLSGILNDQSFPVTLKEAAYYASEVVGSPSSRLNWKRRDLLGVHE